MIKNLFSILKNAGVNVSLPAKKEGKCAIPYAVVDIGKETVSETGKGVYCTFTVSLFAPLDSYGELDTMQMAVFSALKGTSFRFTGSDTEEAGGEVDAYKRVLTFRSIKKL